MSYPTYILDLMTLCWSQQPKDRPSASQIVSIAQAPELTHLIDVASLHDQMAVLSACVTALPPKNEGKITYLYVIFFRKIIVILNYYFVCTLHEN